MTAVGRLVTRVVQLLPVYIGVSVLAGAISFLGIVFGSRVFLEIISTIAIVAAVLIIIAIIVEGVGGKVLQVMASRFLSFLHFPWSDKGGGHG